MSFDHDTLVLISKTWGLIYLIAFFVGTLIYAFWPSNQEGFRRVKRSILDQDDKPCL